MLKGAGAGLQSTVLAFFVGVLLLTTIEDVIPEADAPRPPRWISTLAFAIGFQDWRCYQESSADFPRPASEAAIRTHAVGPTVRSRS